CTETRDPHLSNEISFIIMAQKRQMTALEALEEITRLSDIDIEDSSDTTVDFDEKEDEQLLLIDLIHDQDAGPSGRAKTLPPIA
ncbi:hypothetical protein ILYODFUR_026350, partial [Ilyodon furcidens]